MAHVGWPQRQQTPGVRIVTVLQLAFLVWAAVEAAQGRTGNALVLLVTFAVLQVPRMLRLLLIFDVAFLVVWTLQSLGDVAGFWSRLPWWDTLMHGALPAVLAPTALMLLIRVEVLRTLLRCGEGGRPSRRCCWCCETRPGSSRALPADEHREPRRHPCRMLLSRPSSTRTVLARLAGRSRARSSGGGGIRTLGPPRDGQRFSRPVRRDREAASQLESACRGNTGGNEFRREGLGYPSAAERDSAARMGNGALLVSGRRSCTSSVGAVAGRRGRHPLVAH